MGALRRMSFHRAADRPWLSPRWKQDAPACRKGKQGRRSVSRAPSLFRPLDGLLLFKFLRGFDQSSRLVELHSQSDPGQRKKRIAGFWCGCASCKLCTTLSVLTTLFGIARHVGLHQSDASPVADEDYRFQGARCLSTRQPCAATRSSERIAFGPGHPLTLWQKPQRFLGASRNVRCGQTGKRTLGRTVTGLQYKLG